jgi:hypothetical protein
MARKRPFRAASEPSRQNQKKAVETQGRPGKSPGSGDGRERKEQARRPSGKHGSKKHASVNWFSILQGVGQIGIERPRARGERLPETREGQAKSKTATRRF